MIPGGNLYAMATRLIGKSSYTYFAATGQVTDDRGFRNTTYAAGTSLADSIQPIPRELYESMGLDLDRYYLMVYTDNDLLVLDRGRGADQIEYQSDRYELLSDNDWMPQDGWRGVLAVRLNATVSP